MGKRSVLLVEVPQPINPHEGLKPCRRSALGRSGFPVPQPINPHEGLKLVAGRGEPSPRLGSTANQPARGIETFSLLATTICVVRVPQPINPHEGLKRIEIGQVVVFGCCSTANQPARGIETPPPSGSASSTRKFHSQSTRTRD